MSEAKTIDRETYLKALALYTMAHQHQRRCYEFEIEMNKLLGLEAPRFTGSRVSDEIYSDSPIPFDGVLEIMKITVEEPK